MPDIQKLTEIYVLELLKNNLSEDYKYHNIKHTGDVVETALEIGENSGLTEEELELLDIAAWMHDTGFVKVYSDHEPVSVEIADSFLKKQNYPDDKIAKIKQLILATHPEHEPQNLIEQIIRDADISYIGKKRFYKRSLDLRYEWEIFLNYKYTDYEWTEQNLQFLIKNTFLTTYAFEQYEVQRQKNIEKLKKKLENLENSI